MWSVKMKREIAIIITFVIVSLNYAAQDKDVATKEEAVTSVDTVSLSMPSDSKKDLKKVKSLNKINPTKTNWSKIKDLFL